MKGLQEIWLRLTGETNTFWRRMRWFMLALFTVCVVVGDLSASLLDFQHHIPEQVINWAKYGRVVGLVGAFMAQLTVQNPYAIEFKKKLDEAQKEPQP